MPFDIPSPSTARCLLIATLLSLGVLATVSVRNGYTTRSPQEYDHSPKAGLQVTSLEKRLLGLGGVVGAVPSLLGNLVPGGIASSLVAQVTGDINTLLPILGDTSVDSPSGVPLVTGGPAALPITAKPIATKAQLHGLAGKLEGLLTDILPVAAPSIIAAVTEHAVHVIASLEAIATDVASLGTQVAGDQILAPDALSQIGGLLGSLDLSVNDIIKDVTSNLASDLPLPVLQDVEQAISSGLADVVGAANGPLSLVGDLIEQNVCGIVTPINGVLATVAGFCGGMSSEVAQVSSELATAPVTNPDATLTGDAPTSTIPAVSESPTTAEALTSAVISTSSPPNTQNQGTVMNSNSTGASGAPPTVTSLLPSIQQSTPAGAGSSQTAVTGTVVQSCISNSVQSVATQTVTLTVMPPCPTSSCPQASQATCDCPNASPTSPGSSGAQGPCPGTGYTCKDCLDGWFCPPAQTPAQPAPCGYGWPCAHCEGGWFCAPIQTPGPCGGSSASTTAHPTTSRGAGQAKPKPPPPEQVTGWNYCGCWRDDPSQRAFSPEAFIPELLTNEACIQHCMVSGFLMAGTENGDSCFCGNFLNGTQKMEDAVCSTPCSGDSTQKCGGLHALSCYSPDGEPYGWASAGPQPRAPTIQPPQVASLDIGGVAHTRVTTPVVIFPPKGGDPADIISVYGKITSQPLGDLPRGFTLPSPQSSALPSTPFNGGGVAPGQGTLPVTSSSGPTANPPATPTDPSGPGHSAPSGAPSSPGAFSSSTTPNGNGGVAPGQGTVNSSPSSGQSNPALSTGTTTGASSTNATPSNSGGSMSTAPSNSPSGTGPDIPGTTTPPNGAGGVAPQHGQESSTNPSDQNPITSPPGGSMTPSGMTPSSGSGPTSIESGTMQPSPSRTGTGPGPSPTSPDQSPGQTEGTTTPSGAGSAPSSTPPTGSGGQSNNPSSSSPINGGGVAPGQGQPTTSSLNSVPATCTPGSTDPICIPQIPNESTSPDQSQPATTTPGTESPSCTPGSNDATCTSPNGAGGVAPGHREPSTSTPGPVPSTCAADSTDPSCTAPDSGGGVAPDQNQPSGPTSSTVPASPGSLTSPTGPASATGPTSPTSPTSLENAPSGSSSTCTPGSTDTNCAAPSNNASHSPSGGIASPSTTPTPGSAPTMGDTSFTSNVGSSGKGNGPSGPRSTLNGSNGSTTAPPSPSRGSNEPPLTTATVPPSLSPAPSSTSPSTPNGAGGVAPGQQTPPGPEVTTPSSGISSGGSTSNQPPSTPPGSNGQQSFPGGSGSSPGVSGSGTPTAAADTNTNTELNPEPSNDASATSTPTSPPGTPGQLSQTPTLSLNPSPSPSLSSDNPGAGAAGPNPASTGPTSVSSFAYSPGVVPYGGGGGFSSLPSLTTMTSSLAPPSMLIWREPDGKEGAPTMAMPMPDGNGVVKMLDFEEKETETLTTGSRTTTLFSRSADPRWQRIRPVYVW